MRVHFLLTTATKLFLQIISLEMVQTTIMRQKSWECWVCLKDIKLFFIFRMDRHRLCPRPLISYELTRHWGRCWERLRCKDRWARHSILQDPEWCPTGHPVCREEWPVCSGNCRHNLVSLIFGIRHNLVSWIFGSRHDLISSVFGSRGVCRYLGK